MARPRIPDDQKVRSPVIGVRVPPGLKVQLEELARARGISLTALILPVLQRLVEQKHPESLPAPRGCRGPANRSQP